MTPTPADATVAADLVNTAPRVWSTDRLNDVAALTTFLSDHGLVVDGVSADDLHGVHDLRRRLREVFVTDDEHDAVATLNALLADADVRPRLVAADGGWRWQLAPPDGADVTRSVTAAAAAGLLQLILAKGLDRLGLCAAHGCAGVYVDLTRNHSRRYCTPEICGNRTNLAAYRARRRDEQQT